LPQRSNPFQRIIRLVEQQLAPTGATVEESVFLQNRASGAPTEVDVLITLDAAGGRYRVAVECQDRSRKATVEWVRELRGKYELLDVDRVVAVANSGFTADARKEAAHFGITLLTIDEAAQFDWQSRLRLLARLMVTDFLYESDGIEVKMSGSGAQPSAFAPDLRQIAICLPRNDGYEHLGELVLSAQMFLDRMLASPGVDGILAQGTQKRPDGVTLLCADLPQGAAIFDAAGRRLNLHKLCYRIRRSVISAEVPLRHGGYDGAAVAVGSTTTGGEIDVAMSQVEGEAVAGKVRVLHASREWIWDIGDVTQGLDTVPTDAERAGAENARPTTAAPNSMSESGGDRRRVEDIHSGVTWTCNIYERTNNGGFRRGVQEPIEFVLCISQGATIVLALGEGEFAALRDEELLERIARETGGDR
jgi:hypothetical protein